MTNCMKYPKVDTLYTRDDNHVITNVIRRPEFLVPAEWLVTEKIDGTNIRVSLESAPMCACGDSGSCDSCVKQEWVMRINGRNDNSQIPPNLLKHLQETFTLDGLKSLWRCNKNCEEAGNQPGREPYQCPDLDPYSITLYGEGYGGGIQKGGGQYTSKTKGGAASFRLFDVFIGETWLDRENIEDIASKLGIKTVPLIGKELDLETIIDMVRNGMQSAVASQEGDSVHVAEGIMAFTSPPLFNSRGKRLMFKLKTRDFAGGYR